MKMIVAVTLALVAVAVAAPPQSEKEKIPEQTIEYGNQQDAEGYKFNFKTDGGNERSEEGKLKDSVDEDNKPIKVISIEGSYQYVKEDGSLETIRYWADETGFHAEGPSVPTSPPARR